MKATVKASITYSINKSQKRKSACTMFSHEMVPGGQYQRRYCRDIAMLREQISPDDLWALGCRGEGEEGLEVEKYSIQGQSGGVLSPLK